VKKIVVGDIRQWLIKAEELAIEEAGSEQKFMETLQKRMSPSHNLQYISKPCAFQHLLDGPSFHNWPLECSYYHCN